MMYIQKEKVISLNLFITQNYDFTHYKDQLVKFYFFSYLLPTLIDFSVDILDDKRNDQIIFDPCARFLKHIVGFRDTGLLGALLPVKRSLVLTW